MAPWNRGIYQAGLAGAVFLLVACSSPIDQTATTKPDDGLSLSSASNQVYECLTNKGWTPTLTWDGGIEVSSDTLPDAQWDLYQSDATECWSVIDDRVAQMTTDTISDVYGSELKTRDCLIGKKIEVGAPPSEQEYIDTFQSSRWSAYGDSNVQNVLESDDSWRAINEACPQPAWSLGAS